MCHEKRQKKCGLWLVPSDLSGNIFTYWPYDICALPHTGPQFETESTMWRRNQYESVWIVKLIWIKEHAKKWRKKKDLLYKIKSNGGWSDSNFSVYSQQYPWLAHTVTYSHADPLTRGHRLEGLIDTPRICPGSLLHDVQRSPCKGSSWPLKGSAHWRSEITPLSKHFESWRLQKKWSEISHVMTCHMLSRAISLLTYVFRCFPLVRRSQ